jgi:high-affinity iron transporter
MLPSFVIGLREGLEAALIVGIIAAFLITQGRSLRPMWWGVGIAIAVCATAAIGFGVVGSTLSFRAREIAEGILALIAVAGVTYMIVWMRRHAPQMRGDLETRAAVALAAGSGLALVVMAFLAVLREGVETAVFLLAAFQQTADPLAAGIGALLGVLVAVGLGYGIYRGGIRINYARFFKVTGLILVFVAAGLLAASVHSLAEARMVTIGQHAATNLSWLVEPGTVRASLITGMFGLQPVPTVAEVTIWFIYAVPMAVYVLRPSKRREPRTDPVPATS